MLGSLLQLETETKARLRPAAARLGVSLVELEASRSKGIALSRTLEGMDWKAAMAHVATVVAAVVDRYREIAKVAPPDHKDLLERPETTAHLVQVFLE